MAGLAGCGVATGSAATGGLKSSDPLPTAVPQGASLSIASSQQAQELAVTYAGLLDELPFTVSSWPNIGPGPDVINAFRAKSLDVANNAGIPPIQAHFQGQGARVTAVNLTRRPIYVFATKPHSDIATVADFKGKKLAFSQGQAQGVVLLRALKKAGIDYSNKEVDLIPLTSNQFLPALQSGQVDIAPLGISQVPSYLQQYGGDGAKTIKTDVIDRLDILWSPDEVLAQPDKAAAIRAYIPIWAKSKVWVYEHPDEWVQKYYVDSQKLTAEQGQSIVELTSKPLFPPTWDEAVQWEQETVDLLAEGGFVKSFKAELLFDRRFEGLTAQAVPQTYRS
ncbi:MAG TPA: ABC transporter substrate-binding protein [Microlunatus sp.]|nr:ABC transporter substrate-binding protein [Microlunatus sp.]